MTSIYDQHDRAFNKVSGFVICDSKGDRVATAAFKRGQAVSCYFHLIGIEMTKGIAHGGGYDRASAAAYDAIMKAKVKDGACPSVLKLLPVFQAALKEGNGGSRWDNALIKAGFKVMAAI